MQLLLSGDSLCLLDAEYREKYNQTLSMRIDLLAITDPVTHASDDSLPVVEGDEGYKYLQKLSRDHCNKVG